MLFLNKITKIKLNAIKKNVFMFPTFCIKPKNTTPYSDKKPNLATKKFGKVMPLSPAIPLSTLSASSNALALKKYPSDIDEVKRHYPS